MPRVPLFCLPRSTTWRAMLLCAAVTTPTIVMAEKQTWSVHAFGLKVGELSVSVKETATSYSGKGSFRTTGLAGALRRARFNISGRGAISSNTPRPQHYEGYIDTGKRVSETTLAFKGGVPIKTKGKQKSKTPIARAQLRGAFDPLTVMWLSLQDKTDGELCTLQQKQFDGTRLVHIKLLSRKNQGEKVTCSGTYDRIGGYSQKELDIMKVSPLSITYTRQGAMWRATEIHLTSRHGKARMFRRD